MSRTSSRVTWEAPQCRVRLGALRVTTGGWGARSAIIEVFSFLWGLGASQFGNHVLNSFDDGNCELFGFYVPRGEPLTVFPLDFDVAEVGGDDGSFELLAFVEGNGVYSCHGMKKSQG